MTPGQILQKMEKLNTEAREAEKNHDDKEVLRLSREITDLSDELMRVLDEKE